jgi:hypothetical protein
MEYGNVLSGYSCLNMVTLGSSNPIAIGGSMARRDVFVAILISHQPIGACQIMAAERNLVQ